MKTTKITFWITTGIIFLTQGLMPVFTTNAEGSKEAMAHLGYPPYFIMMLAIFKLLGGLALIIPQVPGRIKEWAYAGFAIDFLAAFVSLTATDGLGPISLFPVIAFVLLVISYWCYYRIQTSHKNA